MKCIVILFGFALGLVATADEPLESFKLQLSCSRFGGADSATLMVHADIEYDGTSNTCSADKGAYYYKSETYQLSFQCQKPSSVSTDKAHPIQVWVLSIRGGPDQGRLSKLVLLMDHATKLANGFATSEDGLAYSFACKKW